MTQRHERYAEHYKIKESQIPLFPKMYWATGFDFPDVPVITNDKPDQIQRFQWGLIPNGTDTARDNMIQIQGKGLNARNDKLLRYPVWRDAVYNKRCLVVMDGFYEYHHVPGAKNKVPYHISLSSEPVTTMAGIWNQWKDQSSDIVRNTFSIVTTDGNDIMSQIHNNPDLKKRNSGPRMPVILEQHQYEGWLNLDLSDKAGKDELEELMQPLPASLLSYYTVSTLAGNNGSGNTEKAAERFEWPIIGLP